MSMTRKQRLGLDRKVTLTISVQDYTNITACLHIVEFHARERIRNLDGLPETADIKDWLDFNRGFLAEIRDTLSVLTSSFCEVVK